MLFPYFNSSSDPQRSQHDLYIEYITKIKVSDYTTSGCWPLLVGFLMLKSSLHVNLLWMLLLRLCMLLWRVNIFCTRCNYAPLLHSTFTLLFLSRFFIPLPLLFFLFFLTFSFQDEFIHTTTTIPPPMAHELTFPHSSLILSSKSVVLFSFSCPKLSSL